MQLTNYDSNVLYVQANELGREYSLSVESAPVITYSTATNWVTNWVPNWEHSNSTTTDCKYYDNPYTGLHEVHYYWSDVDWPYIYNTLNYSNGSITLNITTCEDKSDCIDDHFAEDVDKMLEEYI